MYNLYTYLTEQNIICDHWNNRFGKNLYCFRKLLRRLWWNDFQFLNENRVDLLNENNTNTIPRESTNNFHSWIYTKSNREGQDRFSGVIEYNWMPRSQIQFHSSLMNQIPFPHPVKYILKSAYLKSNRILHWLSTILQMKQIQ